MFHLIQLSSIFYITYYYLFLFVHSQIDDSCLWKNTYLNKAIRLQSLNNPNFYIRNTNNTFLALENRIDDNSLFYVRDAFVRGNPLKARYVRLARTDNIATPINIMGMEVYDQNNQMILNQTIIPSIVPQYNSVSVFGPQFLIDKNVDKLNESGNGPYFTGLAHSKGSPNAYMQLDLGKEIEISKVIIYNRLDCCNNRIVGTSVILLSEKKYPIYTRPINTIENKYEIQIPSGKCTISLESLKNPSYYWYQDSNINRLKFELASNTYLFQLKTSFIPTRFANEKETAFIPVNSPTDFVRSCSNHVVIDNNLKQNKYCNKEHNVYYNDILFNIILIVRESNPPTYIPIFKEDFEDEDDSNLPYSNNFILKRWNQINGSIDLMGPTSKSYPTIKCAENSGKCISLDGSTSLSVDMITKDSFYSIFPRSCKLSYFLASSAKKTRTAFISVIDKTTNTVYSTDARKIPTGTPYKEFYQNFQLTANTSIKIRVKSDVPGDNYGLFMDNLFLTCTIPSFETIFYDNFEMESIASSLSFWTVSSGSVNIVGPKTISSNYQCKDLSKQCITLVSNTNSPTILTSKNVFTSTNDRICRLKYSLSGSQKGSVSNHATVSIIDAINPMIMYANDNGISLPFNALWKDYEITFSVQGNKSFRLQIKQDKSTSNYGLVLDDIQLQCTLLNNDKYEMSTPIVPVTSSSSDYKLLFLETFEYLKNNNPSFNILLDKWNIVKGAIDLKGKGSTHFKSFLCSQNSNNCIDMDGSVYNSGIIESKQSFLFNIPNTCKLNYALSGSQRKDGKNRVSVSIIDSINKTIMYSTDNGIIKDPNESFTLYSQQFDIASDKSIKIRIAADNQLNNISAPSDNMGLILDDVSLYCKPKYMKSMKDVSTNASTYELNINVCLDSIGIKAINTLINDMSQTIYNQFNHIIKINIRSTSIGCNQCNQFTSSFNCIEGYPTNVDSSIVPNRIFGICNTTSSCSDLANKYKNMVYTTINLAEMNINTIFNDTSNIIINDIKKVPSCPYLKGGIAIPKYNEYNKNIEYSCQCPVDKKIINTVNGLECKIKQKKCLQCNWLKKCFTYNQTTYQSSCNIQDVAKSDRLGSIPYPNDEYVQNYINKNDLNNPILSGPRIEISITREYPSNTFNNNNIFKKAYTWSYYQNNYNTIFNNEIKLQKVGKYIINLDAYDYSAIPTKCSTTLSVRDSYQPQPPVNIQCPINQAITDQIYNSNNYKNVLKSLTDYNTWLSKIQNDVCGDNERCDSFSYQQTILGSDKLTNIPLSGISTCFHLKSNDFSIFSTYMNTIQLTSTSVPPSLKLKKCCNLSYTAKEKVKNWECPSTNQLDGAWNKENTQCIGNTKGSCSWNTCLIPNANDFFQTNIKINTNTMESSRIVATDKSITIRYKPSEEIYIQLNCPTLNSNCYYNGKLINLFDISYNYKEFIRTSFGLTSLPNINEIIKLRYRVNSGQWILFDLNSNVLFDSVVNTITIEAYTAIGQIGTSLTFKVYQYTTVDFNLCPIMEQTSWIQISQRENMLNNNSNVMCNYPYSDFGEFTFQFDPFNYNISSLLLINGYKYQSTVCQIAYKKLDNRYTSYVKIAEFGNRSVVENYGVNLITLPTTQKLTELKMICNVVVLNKNNIQSTQTCSKDLVFQDCDGPTWDCPYTGCQTNCTSLTLKKPNQICGGNIISHKFNENTLITTFDSKYKKDASCCQTCGSSQCESVLSGSIELKQCLVASKDELNKNYLLSIMSSSKQFIHKMGNYIFTTVLTIMGCTLITFAIIFNKFKKRQNNHDEQIYHPLL